MNRQKVFKIGIDCRFWGIKHAGLGRYTRQLVLSMLRVKPKDLHLILFFQKNDWLKDKQLLSQCKIVEVNIPHYSLKEQLLMARVVDKQNLDLVHFPHFNAPIFLKTPLIATVHDLIKHKFKGQTVTTRLLPIYWLKYCGYHFVINQTIKKARAIITPSIFVKKQIGKYYPFSQKKIKVIYEGITALFGQNKIFESKNFVNFFSKIEKKYRLSKPFFIYTGSAYPFKDLPTLLKAIKKLAKYQLIIACSRNVFWQRLKRQVEAMGLEKLVVLPGQVPDQDLHILYRQASAFVTCSLMEGFGLPALEAMASGTVVISARAGSLEEIYSKGSLYFSPKNTFELTAKMREVLNFSPLRRQLQIKQGFRQAKLYSWEKTAGKTLQVYRQALKTLN